MLTLFDYYFNHNTKFLPLLLPYYFPYCFIIASSMIFLVSSFSISTVISL